LRSLPMLPRGLPLQLRKCMLERFLQLDKVVLIWQGQQWSPHGQTVDDIKVVG
jgi:hypothetical protein